MEDTRFTWNKAFLRALEHDLWGQVPVVRPAAPASSCAVPDARLTLGAGGGGAGWLPAAASGSSSGE
jgi:hypothetical protein